MADERERELERARHGDVDMARRYLRSLMRNGDPLDTLAELLAGQLLELRSRLLLHNATSFTFHGGDMSDAFKITVSKAYSPEDDSWVILKHYGDVPVGDDAGSTPPFQTTVLCEEPAACSSTGRALGYHWLVYGGEAATAAELTTGGLALVEYADVYEAALLAVNLADGRVVPTKFCPTGGLIPASPPSVIHEWEEASLTPEDIASLQGYPAH